MKSAKVKRKSGKADSSRMLSASLLFGVFTFALFIFHSPAPAVVLAVEGRAA
jgi:hypothetical protein